MVSPVALTRVQRLQLQAARDILTPWGLATAVEMGGKHLLLKVWDRAGHLHKVVIACTPRCDEHSINFMRQKTQRLLRLINAREGY